jgi:hypothetical protein
MVLTSGLFALCWPVSHLPFGTSFIIFPLIWCFISYMWHVQLFWILKMPVLKLRMFHYFLICIFIIWKFDTYPATFLRNFISAVSVSWLSFLWVPVLHCCMLMLGQFRAWTEVSSCPKIFEAHEKMLDHLTNFSVTEFIDSVLATWRHPIIPQNWASSTQ